MRKTYYHRPRFDPLESRDLMTIAIVAIPTQFMEESGILAVQVKTTDPEFKPLYSIVSPPMGATIDPNTGLFLFRPPPIQTYYPMIIQATDSVNHTQVATTPLNVYVFDDPPMVSAGVNEAISVGETFSRSGSFSDPNPDTWTGSVDYGDKTGDTPLEIQGHQFMLEHHYGVSGSYVVSVTVIDIQGFQGRAFFGVTVTSTPPEARYTTITKTVTDLYLDPVAIPVVTPALRHRLKPFHKLLVRHHEYRGKTGR
jgi:hypothetical protein